MVRRRKTKSITQPAPSENSSGKTAAIAVGSIAGVGLLALTLAWWRASKSHAGSSSPQNTLGSTLVRQVPDRVVQKAEPLTVWSKDEALTFTEWKIKRGVNNVINYTDATALPREAQFDWYVYVNPSKRDQIEMIVAVRTIPPTDYQVLDSGNKIFRAYRIEMRILYVRPEHYDETRLTEAMEKLTTHYKSKAIEGLVFMGANIQIRSVVILPYEWPLEKLPLAKRITKFHKDIQILVHPDISFNALQKLL